MRDLTPMEPAPRRRLQFSLRTLMAGTAGAAVVCWVVWHVWPQIHGAFVGRKLLRTMAREKSQVAFKSDLKKLLEMNVHISPRLTRIRSMAADSLGEVITRRTASGEYLVTFDPMSTKPYQYEFCFSCWGRLRWARWVDLYLYYMIGPGNEQVEVIVGEPPDPQPSEPRA